MRLYLFLLFAIVIVLMTLPSCLTKELQPLPEIKGYSLPGTREAANHCTKRPKVVVIIDTGFGQHMSNPQIKLCKSGHKDFTDGTTTSEYDTTDPVPVDEHGHGTHIAGIINDFGAKSGVNYCLVIMKYFSREADGPANLHRSNDAIRRAINLHADYINYSGGGVIKSTEEKLLIEEFLDKGGKFIAAAGNEGINIDFFHFYPASYDDRIVKVGAVDDNGVQLKMSDYGTGVVFERGKNILSTLPGGQFGYMTGTSQATAIRTGKMLAQEKNTCN